MELENKVAVVTGGGSGIGAATAELFAAQGAAVLISGRTLEKLERTASRKGAAGEIVPFRADVSQPADMQRLYAEVERRWGRLDVMFANAGVNGVWARIDELTPEEWRRTVEINLGGTFHTIKYGVPLMKERGGSIVITSSINGTRKFSAIGSTAYSASKAAQLSVMSNLALELAEHRIRVNAICPGKIATQIQEHSEMRNGVGSEEVAEYRQGGIPLNGEPGRPEQVAELVLFLASERSSHITGTPVWIDGGQSLVQA